MRYTKSLLRVVLAGSLAAGCGGAGATPSTAAAGAAGVVAGGGSLGGAQAAERASMNDAATTNAGSSARGGMPPASGANASAGSNAGRGRGATGQASGASGGSAGPGNTGGVGPSGTGGSAAGGSGSAVGGTVGTAGSASTAAASGECASPVASTSTRPQLTSAQAAEYTIASYLAQAGPLRSLTTDNWDPTAGLGDASAFTPDMTVAADGSGTHTTVQAALEAVTGSTRRYVLVKPGMYREVVTYSGATPVTVYGSDPDASQVVIIHDKSAAEGASQTFTAKSNDMQIMNLTLSNDFATPMSGTNIQALALQTMADKIVLQNVRLHGFQDTLQLMAPNATTRARVYIKDSFIEGDTDYIYGSATVVIEGSTIHYLSSRRGRSAGVMLAPSTSVSNELGFLLIRCTFTADASAPANTNHLGRSWDTSSTMPTPNGQAVIRDSTIGAHVNKTAPWTSAATSGRAYSADNNRFEEYCNQGPGAGP